MNWLLKKLANDDSYFKIFMGILTIYALLGCVLVNWVCDIYPHQTARIIFLLFLGAIGLAYGGRMVNNLAYCKLNNLDPSQRR